MRNWISFFGLILGASLARAEIRAVTVVDKAQMWSSPRAGAKLLGYIPKGTAVEVLSKTGDGDFLRIQVASAKTGALVDGYARAGNFRLDNANTAAAPVPARAKPVVKHEESDHEEDEVIEHPWSFGAGFAGYATSDSTSVTVSGDVRYLWTVWTESMLGLDLTFSKSTFFGSRVAQRFYAPLGKFRPFAHLGYRIVDVTAWDSSAVETGLGFQVLYGHGSSYFELGVIYLIHSVFNEAIPNGFVFGGSSGFRF